MPRAWVPATFFAVAGVRAEGDRSPVTRLASPRLLANRWIGQRACSNLNIEMILSCSRLPVGLLFVGFGVNGLPGDSFQLNHFRLLFW